MSDALHEIPLRTIEGQELKLKDFGAKALLIVNTASKCGLTPQYEGLEKLYRTYRDQGLEIAGFPANDFLQQEPGTDEEIAGFCRTNYDVSFPMFAKVKVVGENKHPLFAQLTAARPDATSPNGNAMRERLKAKAIPIHDEPEVLWNFEKFLVAGNGEVVGRFSPDTRPTTRS